MSDRPLTAEERWPMHRPRLVMEDEVGDLFRCSCGAQDWDYAQGRDAYARHLATLDAARPTPENEWADRLLKAERENHCGDAACQTRRTSAAVAVLTGWKEHQDLCWAVEAFEAEIGTRDPALVGPEPYAARTTPVDGLLNWTEDEWRAAIVEWLGPQRMSIEKPRTEFTYARGAVIAAAILRAALADDNPGAE